MSAACELGYLPMRMGVMCTECGHHPLCHPRETGGGTCLVCDLQIELAYLRGSRLAGEAERKRISDEVQALLTKNLAAGAPESLGRSEFLRGEAWALANVLGLLQQEQQMEYGLRQAREEKGLQAHIGLRAATFGRDGGADWIIPEDMDRPEEEEPLHEWWTR